MAQSSWGKEMSDDMDDEYWNEKPGKRRNFFDDKPTSPPPDSTDSGKKETRCFAQSLKDAGLDIDNEPRDFISMHGGVPRFSKDAGRTHSGSFSSGSATGRPHSLQSACAAVDTPIVCRFQLRSCRAEDFTEQQRGGGGERKEFQCHVIDHQ
nr:uncharacterized protein LOC129265701 [Lytechinus pictus]